MSSERLFVIGATHRTAPIGVREKLALDEVTRPALKGDLGRLSDLKEFAVLGTCNRLEFYAVGEPGAAAGIQEAFCARRGIERSEFDKFRILLTGKQAVLHLFEVASGLDSQMLGETEIFGQVKEAYAAAQQAGSAGPVLNRLFQKAFQAAKHVRTTTAITQGQTSIASVAVELAQDIFGRLEGAKVLVLGSGEIGEKTARAFKSRGAAELVVASRRMERAAELAGLLEAKAIAFEEREGRLADFDVIVSSTSAPGTVVSREAVWAAMRRRPARPLFLIDLALPRDIEASAADLENVFLYNLDDLACIAENNRVAREAEIARCRAILETRAEALLAQVLSSLGAGAGAGVSPRSASAVPPSDALAPPRDPAP